MNDDFTAAAWEYWETHPDRLTATPSMAYAEGVGWARDHLAAQEPEDGALSDRIANLIRDLTDPDDCWFDHDGGCQAHGYLSLTPDQECPHSEAKRLLAARAVGRDAR